jgi:hypothetical protein
MCNIMSAFATSIWNNCNIPLKAWNIWNTWNIHLKHMVGEGRGRSIVVVVGSGGARAPPAPAPAVAREHNCHQHHPWLDRAGGMHDRGQATRDWSEERAAQVMRMTGGRRASERVAWGEARSGRKQRDGLRHGASVWRGRPWPSIIDLGSWKSKHTKVRVWDKIAIPAPWAPYILCWFF